MGMCPGRGEEGCGGRLLARCTASIPIWRSRARIPSRWILRIRRPLYRDFILGEARYTALAKLFPDVAEKLFSQAEEDAKERLESYKRLAKNDLADYAK